MTHVPAGKSAAVASSANKPTVAKIIEIAIDFFVICYSYPVLLFFRRLPAIKQSFFPHRGLCLNYIRSVVFNAI
jgi:hypothetical protein